MLQLLLLELILSGFNFATEIEPDEIKFLDSSESCRDNPDNDWGKELISFVFVSGSEIDESWRLIWCESGRELELIRSGFSKGDEPDEFGCLNWTKSNREDVFWLDDDRELELVDEEEDVEYEEQVVREEDDNKLERRLEESSISVHSLPHALLSSDDLPIFSLENDDMLVSEVIEDLDELLQIFFAMSESNKTALSKRDMRRGGADRLP